MAIENLPRPWFLAALTGLKVSDLLEEPEPRGPERRPRRPSHAEARRRRPRGGGAQRRAEGCERRLS